MRRTLDPKLDVVFTDYRELKAGRLHSTFRVLESRHHEPFDDDLELHLVELPELRDMQENERTSEGSLVGWAKFLAARTDEELAEAAEEDEMIDQAKDVLERLSDDPRARELASWREAHLALDRMQTEMGRQEARSEGLAEGRAEGRAEGIRAVIRLIEQRFGPLTAEQSAQVVSADLERVADRLLTARSFAELLAE